MKLGLTFLSKLLEEISDGLEKSTVGTIVMFCCMGCLIYLVAHDGGTETVESLLSTAMIVAAALLGVNSITDIFKDRPSHRGNQKEECR